MDKSDIGLPTLGLLCVVVAVTFMSMAIHDDNINAKSYVDNNLTCDYIHDKFLPQEEQKYFKHAWYPHVMDKLERGECD